MIEPLLKRFNFNSVYISEDHQSYKQDPKSKIFKRMIEDYHVSAEEILHIGDSSSDIIGASNVGIDTCWVNRHSLPWRYRGNPTYEVNNLSAILTFIK